MFWGENLKFMLLPADEIHISGVRWNMEFSGRDQSSALSLRCCANSPKMKTFCTGPMQQTDFQISSSIKIAQITKKKVDHTNAGKKVILKNWESNHIKSNTTNLWPLQYPCKNSGSYKPGWYHASRKTKVIGYEKYGAMVRACKRATDCVILEYLFCVIIINDK